MNAACSRWPTFARAGARALAAAASMLAAAGAAHAAADIALVPQQVSPHCWFFEGEPGMATAENRGFMSNAGFVVTDAGVIVFDALGTPALGAAMKAAIAKVTPQPIRRVIVSHYHADHFYGLQALAGPGVEIWAQRRATEYLASSQATERLAQRRTELAPWVDERTRVVPPTFLIDGDTDFRFGGLTFRLVHSAGAHTPEDILLYVVEDRALFAGDLVFSGRVPFVGSADSRGWLAAMDRIIALQPAVMVPGHGPASKDAAKDLALTRDYLAYLRATMGRAVREMEPFDEAYRRTDWSRYAALPAFAAANRINAYGTYLTLEQEELNGGSK